MQITQDVIQAQTERTERARSAILAGKFLVTRIGPQQWTVKNGDKLPYVVSLKPILGDSIGNDWTCTCMDFQQRGPQILCKHIEGVRLLEAAQTKTSSIPNKENNMKISKKLTQKLGMILLAVWLILTGIFQLVTFDFPYKAAIMSILAIAAGVLILFDR